jgi:hypothetical protein
MGYVGYDRLINIYIILFSEYKLTFSDSLKTFLTIPLWKRFPLQLEILIHIDMSRTKTLNKSF